MIYLDNAATTPIDPQVLQTYVKTSQRVFGNPSSLNELGTVASRLLQESRRQIAELLMVKENEIAFTSGGTEGDNWVLKGTALAKRDFGGHIIISAVEHPAVSQTAAQLAGLGFIIDIAPVDAKGFVDVLALKKLIREDTILVSVMAVNNEIGAIQPIQEIAELLMDYPTIHFHVDAVQAIGKVPTNLWLPERVDFATFSGHKFHGPRGIGFIYWKEGRKLAPLLNGGGQENNQRSGTENLPAIVAMAKALRLTMEDGAQKQAYMKKNRDYLYASLQEFPEVTIFSGNGDDFSPHILCFGIKGIRGEVVVHAFEEKEIFLSTTSACSSKKNAASSTLHAMGVDDIKAKTAVRISLTETNTLAEMEQFLIQLKFLRQKFSKINHTGGTR
ncbi:cysteine desulfurase family protein [Enterococcus timonensis]|uniref:cysteine desulfurase family protein n=1 Tax=Enterococcus timonensis TaxID=1852364 RepID=UPI0008DB120B|nr:cysteine desulfurase family protein [Enterococcus timonensis]